jgi:iron complex outermembrane receptor protein
MTLPIIPPVVMLMEWCSKKRCALTSSAHRVVAATLVAVCLGFTANRGEAQEAKPDISNLSLDSLTSMEITSVSRKEQKLTEAAAAIFVITNEDIRRSGLTSVAELLRTVPGLDVAEIDANKWPITARGFGERYPDKMLVLLDGRTLYSPLTSGVSWDVQETLLQDIDRIEVIRGPGATLWGSNAVNGVVNIITKGARDTQGGLLEGNFANADRNGGAVRYGGAIGSKGHYRVFAKYFDRDGSPTTDGHPASDKWNDLRGGFRSDWNLSSKTTATLQGDVYRGRAGTTVLGIISLPDALNGDFMDQTITTGGNVLGRWSRNSEHLDTTVQGYFDLANRDETGVLGEFRRAFDIDFVQDFHPESRHDFTWGADFRYSEDRTVGSMNISFNPVGRNTSLYGLFGQDVLSLASNKLKLTLGTKLEHSFYDGFSLQPNLRMVYVPSGHASTWIAISRASESSSRTDADSRSNHDAQFNSTGILTVASDFGSLGIPTEDVVAYEAGSRFQPNHFLALDLVTFYNSYTNRHTHEPGTPYFEGLISSKLLVLPTYTASNIYGETQGIEMLARAQPTHNWELSGSYTLFQIHLHRKSSSQDFDTIAECEGSTPTHKFQLHSLLTLPHKLEVDSSVFYVGRIAGPEISGYTRLDVRAGWKPRSNVEISAGGRNLLQARHAEFGSGELVEAMPVGRTAYVKATWSF